jgi:hypothetical protein
MATIGATKDDIKTDARELAAIAIEDKFPKTGLRAIVVWLRYTTKICLRRD